MVAQTRALTPDAACSPKSSSGSCQSAFKIVDAQDSAAARQSYTAQLGLITAAFYEAISPELAKQRSRTRSITDPTSGTGFGGLYEEQVKPYTGSQVPGRQLGTWQIRYVDAAILEKLKQAKTTIR